MGFLRTFINVFGRRQLSFSFRFPFVLRLPLQRLGANFVRAGRRVKAVHSSHPDGGNAVCRPGLLQAGPALQVLCWARLCKCSNDASSPSPAGTGAGAGSRRFAASPGPARPPSATGYRFAWEPKPKPEPKRHQLGWQRTAPALPASPPPLESLLQSGHLLLV